LDDLPVIIDRQNISLAKINQDIMNMAIDVWFPLAIYYADLPEQAEYKSAHLERIYQLHESSGKHLTSKTASWTGDVHKVDQVHNDTAFAWLTNQVEHHALSYLKELGHDLNKIDLYIQRSWPIVARKGQMVGRHAHQSW
jgi:uncharacterized protein (TIGR02466 family)